MIDIEIENNLIVITTDDPSVKCLLEARYKETKYNPYLKRWNTEETITKIYDNTKVKLNKTTWRFELRLGWAGYVANVFKSFISEDSFMKIIRSIMSDTYPVTPFPGLRDYQNSDILHALKYNRALIQTNTSYGKTQVIATLANYAYMLGNKVLIVTPGKKAKDEVIKRYKLLFGEDVPNKDKSLNCMITSGLLNTKKLKDPVLEKEFTDLLSTYDWLLCDESEYCINDSGKYIFDHLINCKRMYFFSGTADKYMGKMISFANGLDETVIQNKELVKYSGPALVYRLPQNIEVDLINIKTLSLNNIKFDKNDKLEDTNIYTEILSKIWTDPGVCNLLVKIAKKFPMLFIPVNNLINVIYEWIDKYFKGIFRILLICGEGYIYYDLLGNQQKLTLQEACDYIKNGKVDIIPSTSSGYRALDFPGLENIFLLQGIVAGVTLQCVGRVARGKHMNIISLEPAIPKKIPVYTKGFEHRTEMILEYYKYCKITEQVINEINL